MTRLEANRPKAAQQQKAEQQEAHQKALEQAAQQQKALEQAAQQQNAEQQAAQHQKALEQAAAVVKKAQEQINEEARAREVRLRHEALERADDEYLDDLTKLRNQSFTGDVSSRAKKATGHSTVHDEKQAYKSVSHDAKLMKDSRIQSLQKFYKAELGEQ